MSSSLLWLSWVHGVLELCGHQAWGDGCHADVGAKVPHFLKQEKEMEKVKERRREGEKKRGKENEKRKETCLQPSRRPVTANLEAA